MSELSRKARELLAKRQKPDEPTPALSPLRDHRVREVLAAMMRADDPLVRRWAKELYYYDKEISGLDAGLAAAICSPKTDKRVARWLRGFIETRQEPVPAPVYFLLYDWPDPEFRTVLARAIERLTCSHELFAHLCERFPDASYEDGRVRFALAKVLYGDAETRKELESHELVERKPATDRDGRTASTGRRVTGAPAKEGTAATSKRRKRNRKAG